MPLGRVFLCVMICSLLGRGWAQTTSGCSGGCNGGQCLPVENSLTYYCECKGTGRSGNNCEKVANATGPASNSSSPATVTSAGTFSCPVPCNNGECAPTPNSNTYYCKCPAGSSPNASGCSAPAPAASANTTANSTSSGSGTTTCPVECVNGQCLPVENSDAYYCKCNQGFQPPNCLNVNMSLANVIATAPASPPPATANATGAATGTYTCPVACTNGQCLPDLNSDHYYCKCNTGYTGTDCSRGSAVSPSTASTATSGCSINCQRGNCKPVMNSREYYCECPSGYTGWDCGMRTGSAGVASGATSSADSQHGARTLEGWKIFVIVLAALVGSIMAASVAYIIWRKRRSPATFVKFTDGDLEGQQEIEIKRVASSTS